MAVSNSLVKKENEIKEMNTMSTYLTQDLVKNKIIQMIGSEKGSRFIAAISSAVTTNPALQECTQGSILNAALVGESLNLSPSPQLGQYYLVPFKNTKIGVTVAQFQLGYKGYVQLAIRSGYYKKMNVLAIKEGELIKYDPLNEELQVQLIEDEEIRENTETIGYYAMFEYENGFRKSIYWSKKKMNAHAQKYSTAYRSDLKYNNKYSFWSSDFDGMAYKTMLRQLISKWGIMSIELEKAVESDMGAIQEGGQVDYIDNVEDEQMNITTDKDNKKEEVIVVEKSTKQNTNEVEEVNNYEEEYQDPFA